MSLPSEDVIQMRQALFTTYWLGRWQVHKSGMEVRVIDSTRNEDNSWAVGAWNDYAPGEDPASVTVQVPSSLAMLMIPEMDRSMSANEAPIPQPGNMYISLGWITPRIPAALLGDALRMQMRHALSAVQGDFLEVHVNSIHPAMLILDNDCEGDTIAWLAHFLRLSMLQYAEHRRPFDYGSRQLDWPYYTQTGTADVYFPGIHIAIRGVGPAMECELSPERTELIRKASVVADRRGDGVFAGSSLPPLDARVHVESPRSAGESAQDMVRVAFHVTAEDWAFMLSSGAIDPWQQVLRLSHFGSMGLGDLGREISYTSDYQANPFDQLE